MFLILVQQMMMMTKTGMMKMLDRMGVITWAGLAGISPQSLYIDSIILTFPEYCNRQPGARACPHPS
jgi:hypothetical protein